MAKFLKVKVKKSQGDDFSKLEDVKMAIINDKINAFGDSKESPHLLDIELGSIAKDE